MTTTRKRKGKVDTQNILNEKKNTFTFLRERGGFFLVLVLEVEPVLSHTRFEKNDRII
jgi:hypothetical protein